RRPGPGGVLPEGDPGSSRRRRRGSAGSVRGRGARERARNAESAPIGWTAVTVAVGAEGLVKRFGRTEALRGVDFEVERAQVLGVLGPNGAGKTTAGRILTTLLKPDAGTACIDGIDVVREPRRARARIGLTGQYAAVDERLTGLENLEHVGRLFHLR